MDTLKPIKQQTNSYKSYFFHTTNQTPKSWHRGLVTFIFVCLLFTSSGFDFAKITPAKINLTALDRYFEQARKDWKIPGMAVAIVKDGKIMLAKGYGLKEYAKAGNVDENTLFAIASNTKAFTAATLAILVTEGKLNWDDKVRDYLPYFQLYNPYVSEEMTVRDLLCHRSGLGTFSGDLLWYETPYSTQEVIKRAKYLKPQFGFRSGFGYSNLMFMAASEVVAAVSGKPWQEFLKERIFIPLGMISSHTGTNQLKNYENVATPHFLPSGEGAQIVKVPYTHSDTAAGAAAINSNAIDMARWLIMLLNKGKIGDVQILSPTVIWEMWQAQNALGVSENSKKYFPSTHFKNYGLGWSLYDYLGQKIVTHTGALDGMISGVAMVPDINLGIVVLTNSMNSLPSAIINKIIDTYLGVPPTDWSKMSLERTKQFEEKEKLAEEALAKKEKEQKPLPQFQTNLEEYTGSYNDPMYGEASITLENSALILNLLPAPVFISDLTPRFYDTFNLTLRNKFSFIPKGTGTVQFFRDKDGKITHLKIDIPNYDFFFTEMEFQKK